MKEISEKKLEKYFIITEKALKIAKISAPKKTHLHKAAIDFSDMAERYFKDAKHFEKKKDYITAFAALNYAHGWLDCGVRLGYLDGKGDWQLFTLSS